MKNCTWWLCLAVIIAGLALVGAARVAGQEAKENEQQEHAAPPAHAQMPPHPCPPMRVVLTPGMEAVFWHALRITKLIALVIVACHILLAVWVFLDIRKRGEGHGIFVALALLAGFCGAILYALVRLGDLKKV